MSLKAKLDGQEYKVTFSAKSPKGRQAIELSGTKMIQEALRQFIAELFLPCYRERNGFADIFGKMVRKLYYFHKDSC